MVLKEVGKIILTIIDDMEIEIEDIHKDKIIEIMGKKMDEEIMEEEETIIIMIKTKGIEIRTIIKVQNLIPEPTSVITLTLIIITGIKIKIILFLNIPVKIIKTGTTIDKITTISKITITTIDKIKISEITIIQNRI